MHHRKMPNSLKSYFFGAGAAPWWCLSIKPQGDGNRRYKSEPDNRENRAPMIAFAQRQLPPCPMLVFVSGVLTAVTHRPSLATLRMADHKTERLRKANRALQMVIATELWIFQISSRTCGTGSLKMACRTREANEWKRKKCAR